MAKWFFEPGHTAAEFCARHMMVTYVRGCFKNVHDTLEFDPANPRASSVEVTIDAKQPWTGEPDRDAHLRNADFGDVDKYPVITFKGSDVDLAGDHDYIVHGDLTIRGVTKRVPLHVTYLGQWQTPCLPCRRPGVGRQHGQRAESTRRFRREDQHQSS